MVDQGVLTNLSVEMEHCEIEVDGDRGKAGPVIYAGGAVVKSYGLQKEADGVWRIRTDKDRPLPEPTPEQLKDVSHGRLATFIDRYTMQYMREYAHPVERVWEAMTRVPYLDRWLIGGWKLEEPIGLGTTYACGWCDWGAEKIEAFEPLKTIAFGAQHFDLEPTDSGTRITLTLAYGPRDPSISDNFPPGDPGAGRPGGPDTPWVLGVLAGYHCAMDDLGPCLDFIAAPDSVEGAPPSHGGRAVWVVLCEKYREFVAASIPAAEDG